jgi:cytochrome P450
MEPFEGIPGPTPVYPFGTLLDFRGSLPWDVMGDYAEKYGPMTVAWFGGSPKVILNDPALIREVLVDNFDDYYKNYPIKALAPVLRNTLFVLNNPEWTVLRKAHPCFVDQFDEWLPTQLPVIQNVVNKHLEGMLASGGDLDILDRIQRMIFEVLNACVVGPDFMDGGFDQFDVMSKVSTVRMNLPQWALVPTIRPSYRKAMRLHYGAYENALKKAKQTLDSDANDLLHIYLRQGTDVSDTQLITFLSNFQAGGDISGAAGVVNTLHLLSSHPDASDELFANLRDVIGSEPDYDLETFEKCTLVDHVLRESLRILPPVPLNSRNVSKGKTTTLGEHEIPADTEILIVKQAIQRSAKHWKDPDKFDPSRWANGGVEANPLGSDYFFPFGRGPRMCPGAKISMFCMKVILTTMLSRVALKTSTPYKQIHHCGVAETKELTARLIPHSP